MDISAISEGLKKAGYIPDESLSTTLWLSSVLSRPLLLEGDAGVGKTSIAAALAKMHGRQLIRLQCYEGLDLQQAVYEWNYSRQLLEIRLHEHDPARGNKDFDLSDALRRRCLYHFVDYPSIGREIEIVKNALPEATTQLIESAVAFVHTLRKEDLQKIPGIAETLDWIRALHQLKLTDLPDDPNLILMTLSCLLKTKSDQWQMSADNVTKLLGGERAGVTTGVAAGMSYA